MNRGTKQIYSKLYKMQFFKNFIKVNVKSLCYCNDKSNNDCRIHILMKMMNELLCDGSNEKLVILNHF